MVSFLLGVLLLLSPFLAEAHALTRFAPRSNDDVILGARSSSFFSTTPGARHLLATGSGCTITFQGASISFSVCTTDSFGFTFRWNDLGANMVQVSVSDQNGGWIGFGIGSQMVGSSAVVAFPATGGNSAGGVYANQYYLAGQKTNQVYPGGSLQLSSDGVKAEYSGGVMTMVFTLTLTSSQYPTSKILFANGGAGNPSTGAIPEHTKYYQGSINWYVAPVATSAPVNSTPVSPASAPGPSASTTNDTSTSGSANSGSTNGGSGSSTGLQITSSGGSTPITKVHGFLQFIVWTILFPAGIMFARFFHHLDPLWWHLHRALQGLGFIVFVVGLGLGFKSHATHSGADGTHLIIALVLLGAVVLQILAAVLRPKKDSKIRPAWNVYHHWLGRSAIILAIPNIYIGLHLYNAGSRVNIAYTIIWVAVVLTFGVMEVYWRVWGPWSKAYATKSGTVLPTVASVGSLGAGSANAPERVDRSGNGIERPASLRTVSTGR